MSKQQNISQSLNSALTQVQIIKHSNDNIESDLQEYAQLKKAASNSNLSFNDYLRNKHYKNDPNKIIVADLSNKDIVGDLEGADLTGTILKGATFRYCNLKKVVFCDADLENVSFYHTALTEADFRGAELAGVYFDTSYQESVLSEREDLRGIKFSTNNYLLRQYLVINQQIDKDLEEKKIDFELAKIQNIETKKNQLTEKSSWADYIYGASNEYQKLEQELLAIENKTFTERPHYLINPSLLNVMGMSGNDRSYDPAYVRGTPAQERNTQKQYIKLTREDVEDYLKRTKDKPNLSLNEYAKQKAETPENIDNIVAGEKVIADCTKLDLSGLTFDSLNMSESCFAACNFSGSKFINSDIHKSTFEGAKLDSATFEKVTATDTNFFNVSMENAKIANSDFDRAFISHSVANQNTTIEASKFNYAKARYSKWNGITISDSQFNDANLEGVSLLGGALRGVQAQRIILNNAIMNNAQIIKTDLTDAYMANLQAQEIAFKEEVILKGINASFADLSEAEIDQFTTLEGANLNDAIMNRVKADGVNFSKVYLERARLQEAQLTNATLEGAHMAFADLTKAVIDGAKAAGVDLNNASMDEIKAHEVDFKNALMDNIQAHKGNFEDSVMEATKLRGANLTEAIMNRVNLKKAELENAKLKEAELEAADLENARVNDNTNMAEIKGQVKNGKLLDANGKETSVEAQKILSEAIEKERNSTFLGKMTSNVFKAFEKGAESSKNFVKKPFSTKTAMVAGAALCLLATGAFLASALLTGGLSIVTLGGVAVAAGTFGAGVGYVANRGGACSMLAGAIGALYGGVAGFTLSMFGYATVDKVVEKTTGKNINSHAVDGLQKIEDIAHDVSERFAGGGELGEKGLSVANALEQEASALRNKQQHENELSQAKERSQNSQIHEDRAFLNDIRMQARVAETILQPLKSAEPVKKPQSQGSYVSKYAPQGGPNDQNKSYAERVGGPKEGSFQERTVVDKANQIREIN